MALDRQLRTLVKDRVDRARIGRRDALSRARLMLCAVVAILAVVRLDAAHLPVTMGRGDIRLVDAGIFCAGNQLAAGGGLLRRSRSGRSGSLRLGRRVLRKDDRRGERHGCGKNKALGQVRHETFRYWLDQRDLPRAERPVRKNRAVGGFRTVLFTKEKGPPQEPLSFSLSDLGRLI